ncbi:MAG: AAA family ATPase [Planctomycetaceae bacterium]
MMLRATINFDRYGMSQPPFQGRGETLFVEVPSRTAPTDRLQQALLDGNGLAVLTSSSGLGKTTICRELQRRLQGNWLVAFLQDCGCTTRRSLLQAVLYELGLPYSGLSEQEARLRLFETIAERQPEKQGLILLVDEAQRLSDRLLEELRSLFNHDVDGVPLVRLLLCGDLVLEERLISPALASVHQRVVCHESLMPLTHEESARLIDTKIVHAGGDGWEHVFTRAAMELMCLVSDGFPRNLEHLARFSLQSADQRREPRVNVETVQRSLEALKELPLQWNEPANLEAYSQSEVPKEELDSGDIVDLRTDLADCDESLSVRIGHEIEVSDEEHQPAAVIEFGWEESAEPAEVGHAEPLDELFTRSHHEAHALLDDSEPGLEDTAVFRPETLPLCDAVIDVEEEPAAWEQETIIARHEDDILRSALHTEDKRTATDWIELEVDDRYASLDASARLDILTPAAPVASPVLDAVEESTECQADNCLEAAVLEHVRTIRDEVHSAMSVETDSPASVDDVAIADLVESRSEPQAWAPEGLTDDTAASVHPAMPEWDVIQPEWLAEGTFSPVEIDRSRHVELDPLPAATETPSMMRDGAQDELANAPQAAEVSAEEPWLVDPFEEPLEAAPVLEPVPPVESEQSAMRMNDAGQRPYSQLFSRLRRLRLRFERSPAKRA